jgi:hypothetical protein
MNSSQLRPFVHFFLLNYILSIVVLLINCILSTMLILNYGLSIMFLLLNRIYLSIMFHLNYILSIAQQASIKFVSYIVD